MLKMKVFLIIAYLSTSICCSFPKVKVEKGSLKGINFTLLNGKVIRAFLGVPYAAPPVGWRRFEPPHPVEPWSGTWNATAPRSDCLQLRHHPKSVRILGDEDCLYLNIFTPKIPKESKHLMNVLVYVPGGAFMFGSGAKIYPDYLMNHTDIVFVTMNYRLGVLGFFSTNDQVAPGNYGLKDQSEALRWVKRNIHHFNGDPTKVTFFGNSAGGASVHFHYFSPLSEGLFHNGISLSGTVLNPWARPKNITEKSIRIATLLNCSADTTLAMVQCLREKPANEIVEATRHFLMWKYCPFTPFGPVVEPPNPSAFISINPIEALKRKQILNVPWLVGVVEKEGLYPGAEIIPNDAYLKELNDRWFEIAPNLLAYNFSVSEAEKDNVSSIIKRHYFGDKAISRDTRENLIQLLGDRLFYHDIHDSLKLHSTAVETQKIYCYNFMYKGKDSPYTEYFARNSENYGTGHGDDQFFIINAGLRYANKTGTDAAMVQYMSKLIRTFMIHGQPNTGYLPGSTDWAPIEKNSFLKCQGIFQPGVTKFSLILGNRKNDQFWKKLLPSEYSSYPVMT